MSSDAGPAEQTVEPIDSAWWDVMFVDPNATPTIEAPEILSRDLFTLARVAPEQTLQKQVLTILAAASSAMLEPDNWEAPFAPAVMSARGRSPVPEDLDDVQLALLARTAPLISQPTLRARAADVAWMYGDRRNRELLTMAIEAYTSLPLDRHTWVSVAHDSWRRAVELARRSGKAGRPQLQAALGRMQSLVLAEDSDDFLVADGAELLRLMGQLDPTSARQVADRLRARAAAILGGSVHLSRRFEEEARAWYQRCQDSESAHGCTLRIAETFVREADERVEDETSAAMSTGRLFERAVATLRQLPKSYRQVHGVEQALSQLRDREAQARQTLLDSMVAVDSDPVDITGAVHQARRAIADKGRAEALLEFGRLRPPFDVDGHLRDAREHASRGISQILAQETYSAEGQRVSARPGPAGETDDAATWAQAVRDFEIWIALVVNGYILPAQEVLTFEHRYEFASLLRLCEESHVIPLGHAALWARGIWHGLREDYPSAVSLLVPQVEHLTRCHLKARGVNTLVVDDRGVETEKGLGTLLALAEAEKVFGKRLAFELKALLTSQEGANLRNDIAHGLFSDRSSISHQTVYVWWLALFMAFSPYLAPGSSPTDQEDKEES